MKDGSKHRTRFERVVDNVRFRIFFTGFMCALYLLNLVLAAMSFHIYPNGTYGALAYHVVLSVVACIYSVFFLWRNLDGCSKKRVWAYFALNLVAICFFLAAFFALLVELAMTGNPNDSNNASNNASNANSVSTGTSKRLLARQSGSGGTTSSQSQTNFYPAIGCVVVDIGIVFMYLINLVYIYFRQQKLFPKYAELKDEEGRGAHAQMTGNDAQNEDGRPAEQAPEEPQSDYTSSAAYEGQTNYRLGDHSSPPPHYGAGGSSLPSPYGAGAGYAQQGHQPPSYGYAYSGSTAYGQPPPQYPPAAAQEETPYHGQALYPGRTPYPRSEYSLR